MNFILRNRQQSSEKKSSGSPDSDLDSLLRFFLIFRKLDNNQPLSPPEGKWLLDFADGNLILPYIAYRLLNYNKKKLFPVDIILHLKQIVELNNIRTSLFKSDLITLAEKAPQDSLTLTKGTIQLVKPYWENFKGYLSQDIDILVSPVDFQKIKNHIREDYNCIAIETDSAVFQSKDKLVTIDLRKISESKIEYSALLKSISTTTCKISLDNSSVKIPSIESRITHRIYHSIIHHNDIIPLQVKDLLDLNFLTCCVNTDKQWIEIFEKIKSSSLFIFTCHLFYIIRRYIGNKNIPTDLFSCTISKSLVRLLLGLEKDGSLFQYAFERAIIWRLQKLDSYSSSVFFKNLKQAAIIESPTVWRSSSHLPFLPNAAGRAFHVLKTVVASIIGEIIYSLR